jgi:dipeptidase
MCDTMIASGRVSAAATTLFAKNSDRQRNEAQNVEVFPRRSYPAGTTVECQYLSIEQARETNALLLLRPFWLWGAEMGANNHSLVIGNEAVHAKRPPAKKQALTGNDLVRLALERAACAAEAIEVIAALLALHGQGGNCGHLKADHYDNSFAIADHDEAFILETLGREWMVERVADIRTISNRYSIDSPERISEGLDNLIRAHGWSGSASHHYAETIANPDREHIGQASARRERSACLLKERCGKLTIRDIFDTLRDHGEEARRDPAWSPDHYPERTICMHAGGPNHSGQTTASFASEIHKRSAVHWVTGTSSPCLSIFKPMFVDVPLPPEAAHSTGRYDPRTLWWMHEHFHRSALLGYFADVLAEIADERAAIEADFVERVGAVLADGDRHDRAALTAQCWREADALERSWNGRMHPRGRAIDSGFAAEWRRFNRLAGMEDAA